MGNQNSSEKAEKHHGSKEHKSDSQPHSPAHSSPLYREKSKDAYHHDQYQREEATPSTRREPRRRESIHTLSGKSSAAPPEVSANLATAAVATPTQSANSHARASTHSRTRSTTATTPRLFPQDSTTSATASFASDKQDMGQEQSRQSARPTSRDRKHQHLDKPVVPEVKTSPVSRPVDVPVAAQSFEPSPLDPHAPPAEAYHLPPSNYSRPPRLPLPIEEESHTPGSPIILAADLTSPADGNDLGEDHIPRRSSVISSTVDDEEDPEDFDAIYANRQPPGRTVPTPVEWRYEAERVYVTGSFADFWRKKFRMYKNDNGVFSTTLQLAPGTHHLAFIVETAAGTSSMISSPDLPTTVEFSTMLVNYVDVPEPAENEATPVGDQASTQPSRPRDIPLRPSETEEAAVSGRPSPTPHTESHLSPTSHPGGSTSQGDGSTTPQLEKSQSDVNAQSKIVVQPPKEYTSEIPAYMLDLDVWPPPTASPTDSPNSPAARFQRSQAVQSALPQPPTLPMFLSKSILNASVPALKDDSSVLTMPNHTVLNHLATTNIKNGVLATSATTRYKRKFLTTILYKPKDDAGD